jgi:hypothetical protein
MRPALLLVLPLAVGCVPILPGDPAFDVPPGEVRAVSVSVVPDRLVVRLSDGQRCRAERPEGETGGWSGVTAECGYALPFTVVFRQGGSPSRYIIEDPAVLPAGPDGGPGPRAEVFLTDVDGQRRLFVAPLSESVRFETVAPTG